MTEEAKKIASEMYIYLMKRAIDCGHTTDSQVEEITLSCRNMAINFDRNILGITETS